MPKLNVTHLPSRLQKRIEQLENDEASEARDINALLTTEQQQALKDLWAIQQTLRKTHKPPKTDDEKIKVGWKTIREVRLEIYKRALKEAIDSGEDFVLQELEQAKVKSARVFMDAWSKAYDEDKNAMSAGNIALRRNGFNRLDGAITENAGLRKRDREVREMEDALRQKLEADLSAEEKEQLALSKEYDKAVAKRRKT